MKSEHIINTNLFLQNLSNAPDYYVIVWLSNNGPLDLAAKTNDLNKMYLWLEHFNWATCLCFVQIFKKTTSKEPLLGI
jgi:hypothetical protein